MFDVCHIDTNYTCLVDQVIRITDGSLVVSGGIAVDSADWSYNQPQLEDEHVNNQRIEAFNMTPRSQNLLRGK